MSAPVKTYRIYSFDARRQIVSADFIDAPSYAEAIAAAEAVGFGTKGELWDGHRLIAQLEERAA